MAEKQQPSPSPSKDNWIILFFNEATLGGAEEVRIVKNTPRFHVEGWANSYIEAGKYKFFEILSTEVLKVPENTVTIKVTYEAI